MFYTTSKTEGEVVHVKIVEIQREYTINPVSSSFPKGSHSATKTELKLI